jgi:[amino group carrier protein]-L-2-aminoadipate 6-kinase
MALTVVKCGGALRTARVCEDVARLVSREERVVLVHGGAPQIARLATELNVPQRTLVSPDGLQSRHTDAAMLDVVTLAMTGRAKPALLRELASAGVRAVGLTGLDAGLLLARRKVAQRAVVDGRTVVIRDGHSGRIVSVNTDVLRVLLDAGFVPVMSPPAAGEDGHPLNVDADRAAAAVAVALKADRLILLTAAPGVLADSADPASLLAHCPLTADGPVPYAASGGMHRKLIAAREAVTGGVGDVIIADGRIPRPLTEVAGTIMEVVM